MYVTLNVCRRTHDIRIIPSVANVFNPRFKITNLSENDDAVSKRVVYVLSALSYAFQIRVNLSRPVARAESGHVFYVGPLNAPYNHHESAYRRRVVISFVK